MNHKSNLGHDHSSTASEIDRRAHPRFEPTESHATLWTVDGRQLKVQVIDVSQGGIGIAHDSLADLNVNQHVQIAYCGVTRSGQIRYVQSDKEPCRAGIEWTM